MATIRPSVTVLGQDDMARVHEYSLRILADVGIRVDSGRARDLFAGKSCRVTDDKRVRIEPELVQWAIDAAPATIDIFDRIGNKAFTLGRADLNQTRFGIGVTNLYYQDPLTDDVEPFSIDHMDVAARLVNKLDQFDVISTPGIAQDLPPETADLHSTLRITANTVKPIVLLISESRLFDASLDLLKNLHGNLDRKPFVIPYFNPITPLVLNDETADKMIATIGRGLPMVYNNYGMSGATAPITPGGTLAVLNAELLAGLVFSQLVKEGTPIILGSLPAGFEMKTMMSLYTPHTMLLNLACAEMMAYYDLPHSGTSGSGPGWGPDLLAGGAFWMNHFTGCMGKVGLAPHVGGNFDSLAFSPTAVVYADEVIRLSRQFTDGFAIDDTSVAPEEIATIGPGGNFLVSGLTCKLFREMKYESSIWPALTLDQWNEKAQPRAGAMLREYTASIVDNLEAPEDYEQLMTRGTEFIQKATGSTGK